MLRMFLMAMALCWLAGGSGPAQAATPKTENAEMTPTAARVEPFAEFVTPADSLPHLRFLADGKISLNDRCPVRKVRLNPRMGAAYVNGFPVGFC